MILLSVKFVLVLSNFYKRHQTTTDRKYVKYRFSNSTDGIQNAFIAVELTFHLGAHLTRYLYVIVLYIFYFYESLLAVKCLHV